jgi:hypothetical protein
MLGKADRDLPESFCMLQLPKDLEGLTEGKKPGFGATASFGGMARYCIRTRTKKCIRESKEFKQV